MFIPSYKKPGGGGGYTPPSWSTGTDEEIVEALEKHYNNEIDLTEYWSVGDERTISLSAMSASTGVTESHAAQNIVLVLSHVGGITLKTAINGHTECVFQVDQKDCLNEIGVMSSSNKSGWPNTGRRNWCNSTYRNAFPSTIVEIFKQFDNVSYQRTSVYSSSASKFTSTDYFAYRAEYEVFGAITCGYNSESTSQVQADWYKTSNNRIKKINNTADTWVLRSGYSSTSSTTDAPYWHIQINSSGSESSCNQSSGRGIAPFGVI